MALHTAYIALGANLGDRAGNIESALAALGATTGVSVVRRSSLVENPAVGGPEDAPAFLNGVAEVITSLAPEALLERLLEIERALGRERRTRWEPRPIDLDLILYGDCVIDSEHLQVPHPLMQERRFVLGPLAELAPDLVHPVSELTVREMLADLDEPEPVPLATDGIITADLACIGCGYNLRNLPVRHECPECGRPTLDTLDARRLEFPRRDLRFQLTEEFARNHGHAPEAVRLVFDALIEAASRRAEAEAADAPVRHASAREVVAALAELVRTRFWGDGDAAAEALLAWGIRGSEDVGRIVFDMVAAEWFTASEADSPADFDGLFVTTALFAPPPDNRNEPRQPI